MRHASMLVLLLLAACARSEGGDDIKPVASVTTMPVIAGPVEETLAAYGVAEVAPDAERSLVAPVEAVVTRILRPVGSRVAAGEALAVLEPSPASALDLSKAVTAAAAAAAADARARRLRAAGLDSDADVETARAAAQTADAALSSLNARSGVALTLRSPIAGVVEGLPVEIGALAAQGAPVVRIGPLGAVRARLGVEPDQAVGLRPGLSVRLLPLSGGPATDGVVAAVDPRLDPQTRQTMVYVRGSGGGLPPGQALKGVIVLGRHTAAALIPRMALVYDGARPSVFVVNKGVARRRTIRLGQSVGDTVEVTRGLVAGERVAVDGAAALEEGMAVREAPAVKAAGDEGA